MAQLEIKGHETRGSEVIALLEMLGGINSHNLYGDESYAYYTIDGDKEIKGRVYMFVDEDLLSFTLEQFEEKFPYKVGDKAFAFGNKCTIIDAVWDGGIDEVVYTIKLDTSKYTTTKLSNQLQPYKEEVMAEANKAVFDANAQCCDIMNNLIKEETMKEQIATEDITLEKAVMCTFSEMVEGKQRLRIAMNEGFELKEENGNFFVYKKKGEYPKNFKECCEVLGCKANDFFTNFSYNGCDVEISEYEDKVDDLLQNFRKLKYARDVYWKIAGEQMELGKPWKPEKAEIVHAIFYNFYDDVIDVSVFNLYDNVILCFPTEEMRDAFYENFKDLIEECKELL